MGLQRGSKVGGGPKGSGGWEMKGCAVVVVVVLVVNDAGLVLDVGL